MTEPFQQRYCRHFQVPPDRFVDSLLQRALYPRARLVQALLSLCDRDFFAPDRHFVEGVGRLTLRREFHTELKDFQFHPENRGFLRGALRLRASVSRMSKIFFEVWANDPEGALEAPPASENPFPAKPSSTAEDAPPKSA